MALFRLGSFDVDQLLGRGGMGEVWRGRHVGSEVPVAIKVMTSEALRNESFQRAFAAEVRAVASLDHPHLIRLFDVGQVHAEAARGSAGRLPEGSPYLVMELAAGGNLSTHPPPQRWADVRAVLFDLLDGLAHAHARGVIHRDIKPGNVIWGSPLPGSDQPRVVLSDFGIAHAGEGGGRGGPTWGTPAYMAPERFTLEWRDLGPWTDLYSVGCLAFTVLRGRPPFRGQPLAEAMQAHLYRPVPALRATCAVPAGLDAWLRVLLAKSPHDRFASAADAAWALRELGDADPDAHVRPISGPLQDEDTQAPGSSEGSNRNSRVVRPDRGFDSVGSVSQNEVRTAGALHTVGPAETTWTDDTFDPRAHDWVREGRSHPAAAAPRRLAYPRPPLPGSWRAPVEQGLDAELPGGGLRLFGLRVVRMVDRDAERDALWEALGRVHQRHRATGVLLRGPVGCGKTRLAEWLCERALEVGGAVVLRADHGPGGGVPALARMIAVTLHVHDLGRRALRSRAQAWLAARGVTDERVVRDIVDAAALGAGLGQGESAVDLRTTVRRFVEVLARDRPVILHLDDVAWSATSVGFVSDLLEHDRRLPVLLLLTSRDEALKVRPVVDQALRHMEKERSLQSIAVPALPAPFRIELVRNLLGVEPELARRIAAHTQGNPLFTVSLVRDWVSRGVLVESPEGLCAQAGEELRLPNDLGEVWARRLGDLLALSGPSGRLALELAAVLGLSVDQSEWLRAWDQPAWCARRTVAETPLPVDLVDRMVDERLAVRVAGGWRFVHDVVREDLLAMASLAGRLRDGHLACSAMLAARGDGSSTGTLIRRGRHLAAADEFDLAAPMLLTAAEQRLTAGDPVSVATLLDEVTEILVGMQSAAGQRLRTRLRLARARLMLESDQYEAARREAEELEQEVSGNTEPELRRAVGQARLLLSRLFLQEGRPNDAARMLDSARAYLESEIELGDLAYLLQVRGEVYYAVGQLDSAEEVLAEAAELVGSMARESEWARCVVALARVAADRGDLVHAEGLLASALERCRSRRDRLGEARALRIGGRVALMRGEVDLADQRLRRAQSIYQRQGVRLVPACRLGRAQVAIVRGQYDEAQRLLDSARQERQGSRANEARILSIELLLAAHRADWVRFDAAGEKLSGLLTRTGLRLTEIQEAGTRAVALASSAGETRRASRMRSLLSS